MNEANNPLSARARWGTWKCIAMPMLVVVTLLLLSACDFPYGSKDDPPEPQTTVLEVRVNPNPVVVGDTTTLTAFIEDSLDTSFEFTWNVDRTPVIITAENSVAWTAPADLGIYGGAVTADNGDAARRPATAEFVISVVE